METLKDQIVIRIAEIINVLLVLIPFSICWYESYADLVSIPFYNRGNWVVIFLFAVVYIVYAKIYDGFNILLNRISEVFGSQALALFVSNAIMYIVMVLLMRHFPSILPLFIAYIAELFFCGLWSVCIHKLYFEIFTPKNTAVIYDTRQDVNEMVSAVGMKKRFKVVKIVDIQEAFDKNLAVLDEIENVFLAGIHSHERNVILKKCIEKNIITPISNNPETDYLLLKSIFETKNISIGSLSIKLNVQDGKLISEIYDGDILDSKNEVKLPKGSNIHLRKTKKVKIFD